MWNDVKLVARNHRLDEQKFFDFAIANENKYKICHEELDRAEVNNWFVDSLIKDFKQANIVVLATTAD